MQRLERETHSRSGAGCEVLHEHIGGGQQTVQHLGRRVLFEVEGQAFLRAVGPDEVRGQAVDALVVAPGEIADAWTREPMVRARNKLPSEFCDAVDQSVAAHVRDIIEALA